DAAVGRVLLKAVSFTLELGQRGRTHSSIGQRLGILGLRQPTERAASREVDVGGSVHADLRRRGACAKNERHAEHEGHFAHHERSSVVCFSITMEPRMTSAAMAPIAASCGASSVPTTPTLNGTSIKTRPSSFLITSRRTLPSRRISLIFASKVSPLN